MKIGFLLEHASSIKNHYGWDHPVIFKLGDKTLMVKDIYNNESGPEMGTIIKLEEKDGI